MISLTCTKCQNLLEMDDAFAGGVCRCQHCGTIQTVPSHLKGTGKAAVGGQKALYSTRTGSGGSAIPSSGLDDLANAVSSSGLGSGLTQQSRGATRIADYAHPPTQQGANRIPLYLGAAILLLVIGGAGAWFFMSSGPQPVAGPTPPGSGTPNPTVINPNKAGSNNGPVEPHFFTLKLDYKRIVFVIDRGSSGVNVFDAVKAGLFDSIESLGAERDFQVLFWPHPGGNVSEFAFPPNGTAKGNADRVADARKQWEDLSASGSTEVVPAVKEAMKRNPDAVVLVTAKGLVLDNNFVKQVLDARKGGRTVFHTVDVDSTGAGQSALEEIAKKTGGTYTRLTTAQLQGR